MKHPLRVGLFFLFLNMVLTANARAQPVEVKPSGFLGWDNKTQGQYVTAFCPDGRGGVWVGTEDNGLFWRGANGQWGHVTSQNGLGDDTVFSLALDRENRLWVGTARGGVSVWDGTQWRTFSVTNGPLSERVRDIAVSPQTGEVWLATEAGLCRYSDEKGWRYSTRLDGLAADQIEAIAFDADANLFVATECNGLSIGHAADDYATWENVRGLETQPISPQGAGLPSNQINDVAVSSGGTVWVATIYGVGKSDDHGKTWFYLRGKNWQQNVEGSAQELKPVTVKTGADLLEEDWVTKIEPTPDGQIWIGYRERGFELRDGEQGDLIYSWRDALGENAIQPDIVDAICPLKNGALIGTYGSGIELTSAGSKNMPTLEGQPNDVALPVSPPVLPNAPTVAQMDALTNRLAALPAGEVHGGFYASDWRTQGNWMGRYGDRNARLYAMQSPSNREIVRAPGAYTIGPEEIGIHDGGGGPFYYLHDLVTDRRVSLHDPNTGKRRPGEINDGGWQGNRYPSNWDGPDLWITLEVPAGTHRAALYFDNFVGHNGTDRMRDYVVHLKAYTDTLQEAEAAPDLDRARLKDFWGGGYLQFWLQGPNKYRLKISSGYSHAVVLQATLLDQIRGPESDFDAKPLPYMGSVRYVTEPTPPAIAGENETITAARKLWGAAEVNADKPGDISAAWMARLLAYRGALSAGAPQVLLDNWRWKLAIWNDEDEKGFVEAMAAGFRSWQDPATPKQY